MFKNLDFRRDVLPHLLAIAAFLVITVIYFSPIFFDNKTLTQSDVLQFKGSSHEIEQYRQSTGEEPLWTNSMFGGMPTYLISTHYSGDLIKYVHNILTLGLPPVASNLFLAMACGYLLLVVLGMEALLAALGAVALAFSSYNLIILEAGHNTKSIAIAYMPLVLAGLIYTFRKRATRNMLVGVMIFAMALALQVRANHMQITYYLLLMVLFYGIAEFIYALRHGLLGDFLKKVVLLGIGAILAVGVSFGRLYTTAEYGKYSIRGKTELSQANAGETQSSGLDRDYAFGWSYGVAESMTLLIPEFFGGASQVELSPKSETGQKLSQMGVPQEQIAQALENIPLYWGDQPFTSGPVYVGAIICFLFVLGLFLVEKKIKYWLLAVTVLSLMLAWGSNFPAFNFFMFEHFPAYNKFRAVSMALVMAQVAMPLLGLLGLSVLLNSPDTPALRKKLLYAAGITGGICLLVVLFAGTASFTGNQDEQIARMGFPMDALKADRESAMRSDALRSMFFIALAAGLLFFYLRKKLSRQVALLLMGALTLIDLWAVDKRYLHDEKFAVRPEESHFAPSAIDEQILRDKDPDYRVFNTTTGITSDGRTSYFHKSIGGYHGAKLRRYQDLIDQHIGQGNLQVLNMLNTKYVITRDKQQPVQQNPGALGNAWFVQNVQLVNSPDEEIAALKGFNAATTAVVDKSKFPLQKTQYSNEGARIRLTEYKPNDLKYEATSPQEGLAVFSEIYYKDGWNAYIDGKPVEHIRANYVLRALPVPAGTHTIEFKFEPKAYALGNTIALISSLALLLGFVGVVVLANTRKPAPAEPQPVAR